MAEQKARHVIPKKHLYRAAFNWEPGFSAAITMNE
ncbi:Uncharacterised protein [[Clostridium] innocuum]|nr:Uncharacterised protein [[Clostridium] innocuum]